ncbi:GGDEF domain-containing protein [Butyrivibrio sp. JL13D10]|uniref:GGDEF domain-containing protein n=1 Tax=Butyrivibrio sp. JL13D10 TaxID=3236815 RepID=UPI0038B4A31A
MPYKKSLAKKLRIIKTTFLVIFIVLSCIYFAILIFNQDFRSRIIDDKWFMASFIVTFLSLLTGFTNLLIDFILVKKNTEIARDLRDLAFLDKLTGLPNRYSIDRISQKYDSKEKLANLGCVLLGIKNLKDINEKSGRSGGDKLISDFCAILESVGTQYGLIGRNSGNEFLLVMENCDRMAVDAFISELMQRIHNHNVISPDCPIELIYSSALADEVHADHFYALITSAYKSFEESTFNDHE